MTPGKAIHIIDKKLIASPDHDPVDSIMVGSSFKHFNFLYAEPLRKEIEL